jgi:hypothetical protein
VFYISFPHYLGVVILLADAELALRMSSSCWPMRNWRCGCRHPVGRCGTGAADVVILLADAELALQVSSSCWPMRNWRCKTVSNTHHQGLYLPG